MGSCGSFADWMRHVYWVEGRVRQIPSSYAVGGETGYTAQEDLKSINSYYRAKGRTGRVWLFLFLHSKTLLGFICTFVLGSPQPLPRISVFLRLRKLWELDREAWCTAMGSQIVGHN